MLKPNKAKKSTQPRITADLTSSQLVLAICVFLCAALVCFSLGVIVGKYDERNRRRSDERLALRPAPVPAQTPGSPAPPAGMKKPGATMVSGEGTQTSPRTVVVPTSPPAQKFSEPAPKSAVEKKDLPGLKEHPAPPAQPPEAASAAEEQPKEPKPAAKPSQEPLAAAEKAAAPDAETAEKKSDAAELAKGGEQKAAAEPPALEPVVKAEPAPAAPKPKEPAVKNDEPSALEPVEKPAPAPAPQKGIYTIQVAALSSPTREQQALKLKKELESEGMQPELLVTKDSSRVCVVVGSYPDRKTAQNACNELRKDKGFPDCFVRTR